MGGPEVTRMESTTRAPLASCRVTTSRPSSGQPAPKGAVEGGGPDPETIVDRLQRDRPKRIVEADAERGFRRFEKVLHRGLAVGLRGLLPLSVDRALALLDPGRDHVHEPRRNAARNRAGHKTAHQRSVLHAAPPVARSCPRHGRTAGTGAHKASSLVAVAVVPASWSCFVRRDNGHLERSRVADVFAGWNVSVRGWLFRSNPPAPCNVSAPPARAACPLFRQVKRAAPAGSRLTFLARRSVAPSPSQPLT